MPPSPSSSLSPKTSTSPPPAPSTPSAGGFIYLGSEHDLNLDRIDAGGKVRIKTSGGIFDGASSTTNPNITGGDTILEAATSDIGSNVKTLRIDLDTDATLTARAGHNIDITEVSGDMLVDNTFSVNDTTLTSADGSIVDAFDDDNLLLRDPHASISSPMISP